MLDLSNTLVPLAVLGASLSGSLHCVGMCGGLVSAVGSTPLRVLLYHGGRLLGYAALGFVAGALGSQIFSETVTGFIPWLSAATMGGVFIFLGIKLWRNEPLHLKAPRFLARFTEPVFGLIFRRMGSSAFLTGLLSVFLPCGWLHSFILGAVATQSALKGSVMLALFWLGSVPALVATPYLVQKVFRPVARRAPKLAAVLLVFAGTAAVGYKAFPLTQSYADKVQRLTQKAQSTSADSQQMPEGCPYHQNQKK